MSRGFTIHVFISFYLNSIIEKVESQNLVTSEQSTSRFLKKNYYFLPLDTLSKKYQFFGKFGILCFLVTTVWRFAFCLIASVICGVASSGNKNIYSKNIHRSEEIFFCSKL